ncbi:hypothetical protein RHGRI_038064 [Rhododendron griersonianum]|uniref:Dihydroflavonol 4-reductase n=1 Tax=Rhododendron griersonianum TaxID=479676 RepID=A0AAV6HU84_9ERIC|nr:hypothetical protein RHGRI_038064 [Rhododendron griersonianum]
MSGAGKTVCVTGASGYIASWIVKFLLQRGYIVKASVRDPSQHRIVFNISKYHCCDYGKVEPWTVSVKGLLIPNLAILRRQSTYFHLTVLKRDFICLKQTYLKKVSFDAAVDGCIGVFHTASPFYHDVKDPQVELIDPALKGTLNVLGSCAKAPSIKRVVLTSSIAAVAYNGRPRTPEVVVDESWFSDPEVCKQNKMWYVLSKTLAEDAAWKFVKEKGIDMVAINPAMVIGPLLQPTLNTSAATILNIINGDSADLLLYLGIKALFRFSLIYLKVHVADSGITVVKDQAKPGVSSKCGKVEQSQKSEVSDALFLIYGFVYDGSHGGLGSAMEKLFGSLYLGWIILCGGWWSYVLKLKSEAGLETFINASFGWVNVKDVANAHVQAFEIPSANGRYCMVERVVHFSGLVEILHKLYPDFQLPEKCADDNPYTPTYQVSKERAKSLGIEFIPIEESIKETVESLKEKKLFSH